LLIALALSIVFSAAGLVGTVESIQRWWQQSLPWLSWNHIHGLFTIIFFLVLVRLVFEKQYLAMKHKFMPYQEPVDPPDIVNAKNTVAAFVVNSAVPAVDAIHEAVRLSAHVVKDSQPNQPFDYFVWSGILWFMPDKTSWQLFQTPDVMRNSHLDVIQRKLLESIVNYRRAVHALYRVVDNLGAHNEILIKHGLLKQIVRWRALHESVKMEFKGLQRIPQLKILREADFNSHLDDPRFPDSIFDEAITNLS